MSVEEDGEQEVPVTVGRVTWGLKGTGYVSGLERIEKKMSIGSNDPYSVGIVNLFARSVLIATLKMSQGRPRDTQYTPLVVRDRAVTGGILTPDECDYVEQQCGFNRDEYLKLP